MEIEFSKNGEGKVLLGIGCRETEDGTYQKILDIADISNNDCKIGDKIHRNQAGDTLLKLVFNKDESIDILIKKLQTLKKLNVEQTLVNQEEICDDPDCYTCKLPLGC